MAANKLCLLFPVRCSTTHVARDWPPASIYRLLLKLYQIILLGDLSRIWQPNRSRWYWKVCYWKFDRILL